MERKPGQIDVACRQVLTEDRAVSSVQWMIMPACYADILTPEVLLEKYLGYIRQATLSLVRPERTAEGVHFRLFPTSVRILTFTGPAVSDDGKVRRVSLAISGGILVQRDQCRRGQMSIASEGCDGGVKVTLCLSDYCPFILGSDRTSTRRKWLYRFTQAYIHKIVTTRFLARMYREVAGKDVCVRVVTVRPVEGEEI